MEENGREWRKDGGGRREEAGETREERGDVPDSQVCSTNALAWPPYKLLSSFLVFS